MHLRLDRGQWTGVDEPLVVKALAEIEEDGHTVLAVFRYGSHLYGSNTSTSDNDYHILFFPNVRSIIAGDQIRSYRKSTASKDGKNTPSDVDVQASDIRSVMKRFSNGEMVAIDLFFAPTNRGAVLYLNRIYKEWWEEVVGQIPPGNLEGVLGYMNNQASKYGLKGTRLGHAMRAVELLQGCLDECGRNVDVTIEDWIIYAKDAGFKVDNEPFSRMITLEMLSSGGKKEKYPAIEILGKKFALNTQASVMLESLSRIVNKYGHRAALAKDNEGVDWKALSHAYRAAVEYCQLRKTGMVRFPLDDEDIRVIKEIKMGKMSFSEAAKLVEEKIEEVRQLKEDGVNTPSRFYPISSRDAVYRLFLVLQERGQLHP